MISCMTRSSSGIRFGSAPSFPPCMGLPPDASVRARREREPMPWSRSLRRLDGGAANAGVGGAGGAGRGGALAVVVDLREQVVGEGVGVHADADQAVAEQDVAEDGRH